MTRTVVLSGWENLSPEEKTSAEEWIKTILLAEKASANLLKLVKHNQANSEFAERLEEILNQSDNLEIIESDTTVSSLNSNDAIRILNISCELVCSKITDVKKRKKCLEDCNTTPK